MQSPITYASHPFLITSASHPFQSRHHLRIPPIPIPSVLSQPLKDPPVRTNEIPRQIPLQAWYMGEACTMLIGGILPFGAVFIELFFIMSSVWLQRE